MTWGAFKEVYRGDGIYWDGVYNVEGMGDYRTIRDAKAAIDRNCERQAAADKAAKEAAIANGAIKCVRNGDMVTVYLPDLGPTEMTMRKYRQTVFEMIDKYGVDPVFVESAP